MTNVPTFSFSSTVGLYELQSANRGALLLMSLTSNTTTPRLALLVVPPQQRPLSVAVTLSVYETRDLSREPTSVIMPEDASILKGCSTSLPPSAHTA